VTTNREHFVSHFSSSTESKRKRYFIDLLERVGWTFLEAGAAGISVDALDLPGWAIVPVATGLAALKGLAARHVGSQYTAATLTYSEDTPKGLGE
jgi:hypothetical protein